MGKKYTYKSGRTVEDTSNEHQQSAVESPVDSNPVVYILLRTKDAFDRLARAISKVSEDEIVEIEEFTN